MKIGVIVPLHSYKEEFKKLREFGISVCQFNAWNASAELTEELTEDMSNRIKDCIMQARDFAKVAKK